MDEKPDQIIGHIESQRHELGRNLNELETRVRATTNWRTYYEKNPVVAVGAALGGGLLLGTIISSSSHSRRSWSSSSPTESSSPSWSEPSASTSSAKGFSSSSSSSSSPRLSSPVTSAQRRQISETMDHVKAALIAFGIAKAKEFLNQAIPGLDTHLSDAEQRGRQHSSMPNSSQRWEPSSASNEPQSSGPHSWQSAGATHHEPTPAM